MDTTSPQLLKQELKMLQQQKGETCVSIIIPFDNSPCDNTARRRVEKAIEAVSDELLLNDRVEAGILIKSLHGLYDQINVEHNEAGLGLFVSESVSHYSWFPFSVKEKISVSKSFDLRDILYKLQYSIPYYVLFFDKHETRLYSGTHRQLLELRNKAFPLKYYDEDLYEMVSNTSSFSHNTVTKRFEISSTQKERFEKFFSRS